MQPSIDCRAKRALLTPWGCLCQQAVAREQPFDHCRECPVGARMRQEHPDKWAAAQGKTIHARLHAGAIVRALNPRALAPESRAKLEKIKELHMEASAVLPGQNKTASPKEMLPRGYWCKNHPGEAARQNKNGRSTGLCLGCLQARAVRNSQNRGKGQLPPAAGVGTKIRELPPEAVAEAREHVAALTERLNRNRRNATSREIKLNFPARHAELLAWLEAEAEANERSLTGQLLFALKKFREAADGQ